VGFLFLNPMMPIIVIELYNNNGAIALISAQLMIGI